MLYDFSCKYFFLRVNTRQIIDIFGPVFCYGLRVPVGQRAPLWQLKYDSDDYDGTIIGETQDIVQDTLTSMIVTFDSQETCDM